MLTLIAIILLFSLINITLGVIAAGFFGLGPLRDSWLVYALSYPYIQPPHWINRWLALITKPMPRQNRSQSKSGSSEASSADGQHRVEP